MALAIFGVKATVPKTTAMMRQASELRWAVPILVGSLTPPLLAPVRLIFITIREQWQESHLCPACWQEMTADKVIRFFAAGDGVEKKFHPSNLSIDCETPRCQGGLYEADNIRGVRSRGAEAR